MRNAKPYVGRISGLLLCLSVIIGSMLVGESYAESAANNNQIIAKPNRCVSLHEGQDCYLNLQLSWSVQHSGDYCLYQRGDGEPVKCWTQASSGKYKIDFKSNKSIVYILRAKDRPDVVAEAVVTVAWVYGSNTRKTNWRLF